MPNSDNALPIYGPDGEVLFYYEPSSDGTHVEFPDSFKVHGTVTLSEDSVNALATSINDGTVTLSKESIDSIASAVAGGSSDADFAEYLDCLNSGVVLIVALLALCFGALCARFFFDRVRG